MTELERLQEVERKARAEGCNIGSDPQNGCEVWLVNQRAEVAERRLDLALKELQALHERFGWQSTADVIAAISPI